MHAYVGPTSDTVEESQRRPCAGRGRVAHSTPAGLAAHRFRYAPLPPSIYLVAHHPFLTSVGRLVRRSTTTERLSTVVELSITQRDANVSDSAPAPQEPVDPAEVIASTAALPADMPASSSTSDMIKDDKEPKAVADDVAGGLGELLDKLRELLQLMEAETEVHPYLKISWTVLSNVAGVTRVKQEHSSKLKALIEKITDVYGFVCKARNLHDDESRVRVLSRLALQTADCGFFISSCLKDSSFMTRLAQQSHSSISAKIDEYSKSFDDLLKDFTNGSQLRTEIATMSVLEDVKRLGGLLVSQRRTASGLLQLRMQTCRISPSSAELATSLARSAWSTLGRRCWMRSGFGRRVARLEYSFSLGPLERANQRSRIRWQGGF
ncbi:hypothetical protein CALCODRAFT_151391 [Calocera cornea HHB12733]|uniref:Uncharacterized protein n=1 Tax=Calocera cornea HHB12733 TaxID=1353952 RepID=A0A165CPF3_9BASI|nr:hypothetical protein CALCODRAFT_151391 [Calocera cornea HHB12733]